MQLSMLTIAISYVALFFVIAWGVLFASLVAFRVFDSDGEGPYERVLDALRGGKRSLKRRLIYWVLVPAGAAAVFAFGWPLALVGRFEAFLSVLGQEKRVSRRGRSGSPMSRSELANDAAKREIDRIRRRSFRVP